MSIEYVYDLAPEIYKTDPGNLIDERKLAEAMRDQLYADKMYDTIAEIVLEACEEVAADFILSMWQQMKDAQLADNPLDLPLTFQPHIKLKDATKEDLDVSIKLLDIAERNLSKSK
jgi:hypothetical protein